MHEIGVKLLEKAEFWEEVWVVSDLASFGICDNFGQTEYLGLTQFLLRQVIGNRDEAQL